MPGGNDDTLLPDRYSSHSAIQLLVCLLENMQECEIAVHWVGEGKLSAKEVLASYDRNF